MFFHHGSNQSTDPTLRVDEFVVWECSEPHLRARIVLSLSEISIPLACGPIRRCSGNKAWVCFNRMQRDFFRIRFDVDIKRWLKVPSCRCFDSPSEQGNCVSLSPDWTRYLFKSRLLLCFVSVDTWLVSSNQLGLLEIPECKATTYLSLSWRAKLHPGFGKYGDCS